MITHTGKIIEGDELKHYLAIVANGLRATANAIHVKDKYGKGPFGSYLGV